MEIVDAQIHLWGQGLPSNQAHIQVTSYTAAEAIAAMDAAGVDAAVIHPPGWDPNSTELAFQAVKDYPGRFAVLGHVPLEQAEAEPLIDGWRDQPGMLGIRYTLLHEPPRSTFDAGGYDWLWAACEKHGVPVALLATDSFPGLVRMAERFPELSLTVDHLGGRGGNTTLKDHEAMVHMPKLLEMARYPNVGVKVTGAPGYSAEAHPFPIMRDYVKQVFDAFGPKRTFWGTDITKMPCSWTECVTMFTEADWLSGDDLAQVMGGAIRDWWGWPKG